jgi:hypothetical protein
VNEVETTSNDGNDGCSNEMFLNYSLGSNAINKHYRLTLDSYWRRDNRAKQYIFEHRQANIFSVKSTV